MNNIKAEAIKHAMAATDLLKRSRAVHDAEMRGEVDPSAAQDEAIALNRAAIQEVGTSLDLFKQAAKHPAPALED